MAVLHLLVDVFAVWFQLKAREDAIAAAKLGLVQDMIVEDERARKAEVKQRHHVEAMREYQVRRTHG